MARLYADEDFSYPVTQQLRQLGHDILTAQEAGQAGQGIQDTSVLASATAAGRAVVTFNRRHLIRLHAEVSSHAGIIVCARDDDVPALANRIHQQLQNAPALHGQLLRVNRPSS
ncbi:MAG TPA: DUF5615 family PIN-like protein [Candidatus Tectomicrobia bacterium]|nr:DUF5615 family PIN-like protein [Candidatus Tectomicrobia bacterium]